MPSGGPMRLFANEKGELPCPKRWDVVPVSACEKCGKYRWARGYENGASTIDCGYVLEMPADKLRRFEGYRDFIYGKNPGYLDSVSDDVDRLVDELLKNLHPHLRNETD